MAKSNQKKEGASGKLLDRQAELDAIDAVQTIQATYRAYRIRLIAAVVVYVSLDALIAGLIAIPSLVYQVGYPAVISVQIVLFVVATFLFRRMKRNAAVYRMLHLDYVRTLRAIGPELLQKGKLTEIRWLMIKTQLSQYGI